MCVCVGRFYETNTLSLPSLYNRISFRKYQTDYYFEWLQPIRMSFFISLILYMTGVTIKLLSSQVYRYNSRQITEINSNGFFYYWDAWPFRNGTKFNCPTIVEGDPKASLSVANPPWRKGKAPVVSLDWSTYLIMQSVKQGSIKYPF